MKGFQSMAQLPTLDNSHTTAISGSEHPSVHQKETGINHTVRSLS